MPDKILLEGIRFHGFHGLTRMEREMGVRYSVDVEMTADLSAAARNDRISDTIDYRKVHHLVVEIGRRESYKLIENPTAENIVVWIWKRLEKALPGLVSIELWEVEGCSVLYRGEGASL